MRLLLRSSSGFSLRRSWRERSAASRSWCWSPHGRGSAGTSFNGIVSAAIAVCSIMLLIVLSDVFKRCSPTSFSRPGCADRVIDFDLAGSAWWPGNFPRLSGGVPGSVGVADGSADAAVQAQRSGSQGHACGSGGMGCARSRDHVRAVRMVAVRGVDRGRPRGSSTYVLSLCRRCTC